MVAFAAQSISYRAQRGLYGTRIGPSCGSAVLRRRQDNGGGVRERLREGIASETHKLTIRDCVEANSNYIQSVHAKAREDKILVVARDTTFIKPLTDELEKAGYMAFDSTYGTRGADHRAVGRWIAYDHEVSDRDQKDRILEELNEAPELTVILGNAAGLSQGKNLQVCNHLVLLDIM